MPTPVNSAYPSSRNVSRTPAAFVNNSDKDPNAFIPQLRLDDPMDNSTSFGKFSSQFLLFGDMLGMETLAWVESYTLQYQIDNLQNNCLDKEN